MTTTYTIRAECTAYVEEASDGEVEELIELNIEILRDDDSIDTFKQRYGSGITNQDLRADIEQKIREIVRTDYTELQQTTLQERCDAIAANLSSWEKTLP